MKQKKPPAPITEANQDTASSQPSCNLVPHTLST